MNIKNTVCIGRSHGIHGEPTTFGLKMARFYDEMKRNRERLERGIKSVAVGKLSGAVGTYATLDPEVEDYVCEKTGARPLAYLHTGSPPRPSRRVYVGHGCLPPHR